MPKNAKKVTKSTDRSSRDLPKEYYQIHSLLHTIRAIGQHDDMLCILQHEIRQAAGLAPDLANELKLVLSSLPVTLFVDEIYELQESADELLKFDKQHSSPVAKTVKGKMKPLGKTKASAPRRRQV